MAHKYTTWKLLFSDIKNSREMAMKLSLPEQICSILQQRGFADDANLHGFLYPRLDHLPSPALMKGIEPAVELILEARAAGREVIVYGDYDVDGVTSTALLYGFLQEIGTLVFFYHPDRIDDGYGLSNSIIELIALRHPGGLMVTVDCGISDHEAIVMMLKKPSKE
jgi:single-stranded-DNA-specific exonuclease